MKMYKLTLFLSLLLFCNHIFSQNSEIVKQYINAYKDIAISEMRRTGVPAAITLAQGIHETEAGTSDLVRASNNHFGIKCKGDWTGGTVYHDDDARGECFRKYSDPADSYKDHSDFLKTRPNYAFLFKYDPADYEGWAWGLKKAGYATNPKYPQILIRLIKDYNLQDYTMIALNEKRNEKEILTAAVNNKIPEPDGPDHGDNNSMKLLKPVYPGGMFKINETSVLFVNRGTSFLKLASDYNIALERLFEFNDMKPEDIAQNGQLIFLQRKRKTGANEFHIVMDGESVYDISQMEGIRMESLLEYNFLHAGLQPASGEKLYLHIKAPGMPKLVSPISSDNSVTVVSSQQKDNVNEETFIHIVQPKESIYSISRKYEITVNDLMRWNQLQSADLKTGQQLKIVKKAVNGTN